MYWRRRMLLLVLVVAVVSVIVLVIARPGSSARPTSSTTTTRPAASAPTSHAPSASVTPTPAAAATSPSGKVTGAPTAGAIAAAKPCKPANVTLTPVTNALRYATGVQPMISMTIENTGTAPCTIDAGTDAQEYLISTGAQRVWDSKDCQTGPTKTVVTLAPGKTVSTTPFAWDRTHSSKTTCSATRAPAIASGASYHLTVLLGSISSETTKQFILL